PQSFGFFAAHALRWSLAPYILADAVAQAATAAVAVATSDELWARTQCSSEEETSQALSFRDTFGNQCRPVSIDPRWLTWTVMDLAQVTYDERCFDRLRILADALMDAGCDNEEILLHCRSDGQHVHGCWLIDLLLGKS